MLVNIEGISGAGKTTAIRLLKQKLGNCITLGGFNVGEGSSVLTKFCNELISKKHMLQLPAISELHLLIAEILMDIEININPALTKDKIVLYDNYWCSVLYYEIARARTIHQNQPMLLDYIRNTIRSAEAYCNIPHPDLTIFIDCPIEIVIKRVEERDGVLLTDNEIRILNEVDKLYKESLFVYPTIIIRNDSTINSLRHKLGEIVMSRKEFTVG